MPRAADAFRNRNRRRSRRNAPNLHGRNNARPKNSWPLPLHSLQFDHLLSGISMHRAGGRNKLTVAKSLRPAGCTRSARSGGAGPIVEQGIQSASEDLFYRIFHKNPRENPLPMLRPSDLRQWKAIVCKSATGQPEHQLYRLSVPAHEFAVKNIGHPSYFAADS